MRTATDQAALLDGLDAREIYRFVDNGQLLFTEDANGLLFVCLESLQQPGKGSFLARPHTPKGL